ncbi:unnamed protein product, partial [Choristocarpus tenellus]
MGGGIAAMATMLLRSEGRGQTSERSTIDLGEGKNTKWGRGAERAVCISFATPPCVSLDLARSCRGWVASIAHADDAVPRLSTVALDLLKEDSTGGKWGRLTLTLTLLFN